MKTYCAIYCSESIEETLEIVDYALTEHCPYGLEQEDDRWDIRDARVIAQRAYYYLHNIEMCEPKLFTKRHRIQMEYLGKFINACKEREEQLRKQGGD